MTQKQIDETAAYYATLDRWKELKETIAHLQAEERALREGIVKGSFPKPKEGTNTLMLPDGRKLKAVVKFNRSVDLEAYEQAGFTPSERKRIFRTTVALQTTAYKSIEDKDFKNKVDNVLTIKPGLPTLNLEAAKPNSEAVSP